MIELTGNTEPLGLPIPAPWLLAIKIFGFFLHTVFMNLWVVGLPAALCMSRRKELVAKRLLRAMPFFMAFGINAGIVPLLFLQTLYPQFFYPATILQAWFWFGVIPSLIVAYYAVYLAASDHYRTVAATVASVILIWIGLTFSAAMSLTAAPQEWPGIFAATSDAGAVNGLFLNLRLESIARFLLMAGISFGTVAAFLALDAEYWTSRSDYLNQARALVAPLYGLGLAVFAAVAIPYGYLVQEQLPRLWWLLAAVTMPLGAVASVVYAKQPAKPWALALVVAHSLVILFNGIARQNVQTRSVELWSKSDALPIRGEWGSLVFFVFVLVVVLVGLVWLARATFRAVYPVLPKSGS